MTSCDSTQLTKPTKRELFLMQFQILGWLINLYNPIRLKEDYHHEGYVLVFRKPWYILKLEKKAVDTKTSSEPDYDDIPF